MTIDYDADDAYTEEPDTYLDGVDGHWYVIRYDRTLPQIHAANCDTCAKLSEAAPTNVLRQPAFCQHPPVVTERKGIS